MNKIYFSTIRIIQELLVGSGVLIVLVLPILLAYAPHTLPSNFLSVSFGISLAAVFFVMSIRPLADLLPQLRFVRPLVILRKGGGVLSASIIVAIMFSRVLVDPSGYFSGFFSPAHWTLTGGAILAPLGDLSALILLVTSNKFSKRVLGPYWKRIQKLAYVYFYAGALYEYIAFHNSFALFASVVVTVLVGAAFIKNRAKRVSV